MITHNEHEIEPLTGTNTTVIRSEIPSADIPILCGKDRNDTFNYTVIVLPRNINSLKIR